MRAAMASLTRGNMHALGECVRQGYVPLPGGFRAGLCGRAIMRGGEVAGLEDVSGICIRITRTLPGASDGVMRHILHAGRARGALIVSAPGLGKTTLLRDIARNLSRAGLNVAVADERGELGRRGAGSGRAYRRDEPVPPRRRRWVCWCVRFDQMHSSRMNWARRATRVRRLTQRAAGWR